MNGHIIGIVICSALAFAIQSLGPADAGVAVYVYGGLDNCNHSDHVEWDCVEINGRVDPCENFRIGADDVQVCKDIYVTSTDICTENNCDNETKDKYRSYPTCQKVGCGE